MSAMQIEEELDDDGEVRRIATWRDAEGAKLRVAIVADKVLVSTARDRWVELDEAQADELDVFLATRRPAVQEVRDMSALEHWADVKDTHDKLVEFFEWLEQNGFEVEITPNGLEAQITPRFGVTTSEFIDRFLSVNRADLDRERRVLLKNAQAKRSHQGEP